MTPVEPPETEPAITGPTKDPAPIDDLSTPPGATWDPGASKIIVIISTIVVTTAKPAPSS